AHRRLPRRHRSRRGHSRRPAAQRAPSPGGAARGPRGGRDGRPRPAAALDSGHAGARRRGRGQDGRPDQAGPGARRLCRRPCRRRRRGAVGGPGIRLRCHRPRRHDPRARRVRGLPDAPLRGPVDAGAAAHRPRRRRRPGAGPRRRRRRLPDEAFRLHGAVRPAPGADPARPRRPADGPGGRRPRPRPRHPSGPPGRHRDLVVGQAVRHPGAVHAPPRRGPLPGRSARARLGLRLRGHVEPRRRLRPDAAGADRPALRRRFDRDGPRGRLPAPHRSSRRPGGDELRRRRFTPVSLRGRLALLFTAGSAVVLVLAGILIYLDLNGELQHTINTGLEARAADIESDINSGRVAIRQEEAFAQILGPGPTVVDSSAPAPPALSAGEWAQASRHDLFLDRRIPHTPALGRRARLLAHPVQAGDRPLVVVVGASTVAVFRGRERLALILAILSPLLGAILSAGGWLLAGAALRPVRRMSQEADAISLAQAGRRLPYPEGEDEIAQLGRTLNAMLDRIEAAFARERMFLDDASHELRTPISVLRAELEVALLESGDREALERSLRSALEEAERLAHLAEDLLVLARASAGRLPLRRRPVDVRALAEQ